MTVLVLGTSAWPLSPPTTSFAIPAEVCDQTTHGAGCGHSTALTGVSGSLDLAPAGRPQFERSLTRFQRFYQNKHSGRKLTWLFNLCKGELKANYCRGSPTGYTFQVSMYQMGILLQYNNATSYTFRDLEASTQLAPDVLKQVLAILTKARVLLSSAEEPDESTKFDLNVDFKSKKIKVNLNMPLKAEQKVEQEETHRHVQEDRKMLIQVRCDPLGRWRRELIKLTSARKPRGSPGRGAAHGRRRSCGS